MKKLPRQWVINVTYTLVGKPFADWVAAKMAARNEQLVAKRDLGIEMDPEIFRAFHASKHVSSKYERFAYLAVFTVFFVVAAMKGTGAHLLKAGSKRRRTQVVIRG